MELRTPAAFNHSVWFYDWLAQIIYGGAIRQSQVALLSFIPPQASVLIIGGGSGWILQDLARLQIPLKITYLEASPGMLAKARQVAAQLSSNFLKIDLRLGTETALLAHEQYQVIFTPFVLDLYPTAQTQQMLHCLLPYLQPGGLWLLADFFIAPELKGWGKWWRSGMARLMYTFFGWLEGLPTNTLPDLSGLFQKLPLNLVSSQSFFNGFIQARAYQKSNS
ncbi:class I SAM-dependent methyltransferase [Adhaeribacter swui]|uniref:Class I SAM-dependent methyltransferase n=1 Tax=Adhaeribacter swui TaxID=2086471 RepID=A0A7G7G3Y3_9BACT|nr:class I SAM-dependent methyltransferase [Adhaeribacter swui]QNF31867.1 class I SAM-dependent methyltransferase [Adhaeribacter swui]